MSRKAAMGGARQPVGGATTTTTTTSTISTEDMCPVCKTIRYLNKDMEFLINPECYHSMCSNCVNRLFNDGPNQCPYAGCNKTLRRKGFRSAFFGDLGVEREVDIRRRVAAVFNQGEDDFETTTDYNNYLQMVEDLTFDLVFGTDRKRQEAEATLQRWEAEHTAQIEQNRRQGREADEMARRRLRAEKDAARLRRIEAVREAEEEKRERALTREAELDSIAQAPEGQGSSRVQLKRRGLAAAAGVNSAAPVATAAATDVGKLSIRGLKEKKKAVVHEGPYDPFGGLDFTPSRYRLGPDLKHQRIEDLRATMRYNPGGFRFEDWTAQLMFEAFAGLGVFVEDEKEVGIGLEAGRVASIGAGIAAVGDRMELD
ncbi:hypothetical protein QBC47DRAFT_411528 [Echria macrotheca]|uniref:RNA polymerase II transcription factor B subunit 3 n=1 Tax=Echria macrotheca TaxID=438768 RepID=A0AAJ0F6Z0_9PEZI|nr:hypothetical protein QBC47DRAFT_411528 [Echria macrotheca]